MPEYFSLNLSIFQYLTTYPALRTTVGSEQIAQRNQAVRSPGVCFLEAIKLIMELGDDDSKVMNVRGSELHVGLFHSQARVPVFTQPMLELMKKKEKASIDNLASYPVYLASTTYIPPRNIS